MTQLVEFNLKRRTDFIDLVLELVINSNYKKLFDIIPLKSLQEQLRDLQVESHSKYCYLPMKFEPEEIIEYFKMSKLKITIYKDNLIISITIPTFYETNYKMIEAIAIPFTHRWNSYMIQATFPHYLMFEKNETLQTFIIPISLEEKINCTNFSKLKLCHPTKAIQIINTTTTGEIENVFNHNFSDCKSRYPNEFDQNHRKCNYHQIPHLNLIIQLSENSYFIYIVMNTTITVICNNNRQQYQVNASIIIRDLENNCSIYFEDGISPEHNNLLIRSIVRSNINFVYNIHRNDLIHKDPTMPGLINFRKNYQSEHIKLREQIRTYNHRNRVSQSIFQSKEFIGISAIALILIVSTWICIFYYNMGIRDKMSKFYY